MSRCPLRIFLWSLLGLAFRLSAGTSLSQQILYIVKEDGAWVYLAKAKVLTTPKGIGVL